MTSEQQKWSYLAMIIIGIAVSFMTIEVLIWAGKVQITELGNLSNGGTITALLENPAFVGILATLIDGIASGFMRNTVETKEKFDYKQLAETFFYYEPLLILISQFIPVNYAIVLVFVIRVAKLAVTKLATLPPATLQNFQMILDALVKQATQPVQPVKPETTVTQPATSTTPPQQ